MFGRRIYASSNGDVWDLVRDSDTARLYVRHTPNLASGGTISQLELGTFLSHGSFKAEHVALLDMIGTLLNGDHPAPGKRERGPYYFR